MTKNSNQGGPALRCPVKQEWPPAGSLNSILRTRSDYLVGTNLENATAASICRKATGLYVQYAIVQSLLLDLWILIPRAPGVGAGQLAVSCRMLCYSQLHPRATAPLWPAASCCCESWKVALIQRGFSGKERAFDLKKNVLRTCSFSTAQERPPFVFEGSNYDRPHGWANCILGLIMTAGPWFEAQ